MNNNSTNTYTKKILDIFLSDNDYIDGRESDTYYKQIQNLFNNIQNNINSQNNQSNQNTQSDQNNQSNQNTQSDQNTKNVNIDFSQLIYYIIKARNLKFTQYIYIYYQSYDILNYYINGTIKLIIDMIWTLPYPTKRNILYYIYSKANIPRWFSLPYYPEDVSSNSYYNDWINRDIAIIYRFMSVDAIISSLPYILNNFSNDIIDKKVQTIINVLTKDAINIIINADILIDRDNGLNNDDYWNSVLNEIQQYININTIPTLYNIMKIALKISNDISFDNIRWTMSNIIYNIPDDLSEILLNVYLSNGGDLCEWLSDVKYVFYRYIDNIYDIDVLTNKFNIIMNRLNGDDLLQVYLSMRKKIENNNTNEDNNTLSESDMKNYLYNLFNNAFDIYYNKYGDYVYYIYGDEINIKKNIVNNIIFYIPSCSSSLEFIIRDWNGDSDFYHDIYRNIRMYLDNLIYQIDNNSLISLSNNIINNISQQFIDDIDVYSVITFTFEELENILKNITLTQQTPIRKDSCIFFRTNETIIEDYYVIYPVDINIAIYNSNDNNDVNYITFDYQYNKTIYKIKLKYELNKQLTDVFKYAYITENYDFLFKPVLKYYILNIDNALIYINEFNIKNISFNIYELNIVLLVEMQDVLS